MTLGLLSAAFPGTPLTGVAHRAAAHRPAGDAVASYVV